VLVDVKIGRQLDCGIKCSAEAVHMRMHNFASYSTHLQPSGPLRRIYTKDGDWVKKKFAALHWPVNLAHAGAKF